MIKNNRIPHIYHDTKYAYKLFEIIYKKHLTIKEIYKKIETFNDLENAKGFILDILGGNFKVFRNGLEDDEYRKKIKLEISTTNFMGNVEEIKKILSSYYGVNTKVFKISEETGKIIITNPNLLSVDVLKKISSIKSAGVKLQGINILNPIDTSTIFNSLVTYRLNSKLKEINKDKKIIKYLILKSTIIYRVERSMYV